MDFILICIFHIVLTSIDLALSALGLSFAIATFSGDLDEPRAPGAPGRHDREGSRVPGLRRQVHPLPLPALPHPEDEEAGMVKPKLPCCRDRLLLLTACLVLEAVLLYSSIFKSSALASMGDELALH